MPTATTKEKKSTKKSSKAKATVTKEAGGKGVKVTKPSKKTSKKGTKKAVPGKVKSDGTTNRAKLFEALATASNGLSRGQLKASTDCTRVSRLMSLEIDRTDGKPVRIKANKVEGISGRVYSLTAAGHKAVKDGTVDSGAPSVKE